MSQLASLLQGRYHHACGSYQMEGSQVINIIIDHLNHLDHLDFLDEEHHLVEGCHLDLDDVIYLDNVLYGLLQSESIDDHSDNLLINFW